MNQDDFRKLLDAGGGGSRGKSGAYGGSRNLTSLDLDGIRKLSAKKSSKKKGSKSHKDSEDGADGEDGDSSRKATTGGQYRDRAAERRQGIKADDMEDVDQYKHLDVEQSKFLGGDMAHTHLVKGLDFALLAQLKREKQKLELATAAERLKINGDGAVALKPQEKEVDIEEELAKEPTFQTRLGRLVYFLACENQPLSSGKRLETKSELFLPGRMYYTFDLKSNDVDSKPVVVQRSKDDCPEPDDVVSGMIDEMTLAEVERVMEQKRSGKKMRRKRPTQDGVTGRDEELAGEDDAIAEEAKDAAAEGSTKPEEEDDDDDDDIFPDAGDYVPAYLRDEDTPEAPVLKSHDEAGYFSNLSASIAEAEEAARRKEEEAEHAWKATLQKAAAAQEKIEKEEAMKARAAKMAAAEHSYGDYDMGGDSDEEEEQAGKKRKGSEAKKDASGGKEIDDDEKDRRKKQKQGNKLANDLKKINKIMESKS